MELQELRPGVIIKGPNWSEPVEINYVEYDDSYVHIIGRTTLTSQHIDQYIPLSDLQDISLNIIRTDFTCEPWKAFAALETKRYRLASLYDPLLAVNTSKIDPLPHQIEAVYGYILKLPRIRFLIADDPGAGKTIMAGLIIKELKLRNLVKRILIVVPGHLKDQWRRELKDRFDESFVIVDRGLLKDHYNENVWEVYNQIITSMDFAKKEDILPSLSSSKFDLVIVDEAHKMSAMVYGDKVEKTDRYKLGEVLSRRTTHLLFLTATPHKGDPENFRLLIDLLEPGFFANADMLNQSIMNKDNPLFIRRMKEDLKDFEGKPLFLPRYVKTIQFRLSEDEKRLYNDLSRYVSEQYNKAINNEKKRGVAFALVILQRRLASSVYALLKSLERRKERLEDILNEVRQINTTAIETEDLEEVDEMSEHERWEVERRWETVSLAENREELKKEIITLDSLIEQARSIISKEIEVKLTQLKNTMADLNLKYPNTKILIFTESKDTLDYLTSKIRSWGYSVNFIHGDMSLEDRIEAEKIFKNETQVMVATEAAGEGINLQFCNLMINYDIPWNPNRLEQRMGRIHRYGQSKEVYVFNLIATDTREGRVLLRLFDKLDEIRRALGDKVFDVVSEIIYNRNLSQLMLEAASNARSIEEILRELDIKVDEEYIRKVKEDLGESLATKYIDYTRLKEMQEKAKENRLIPEYTETFFKRVFEKIGGRYHERKDKFLSVDRIPYEIRYIANEDSFKKRFGSLLDSYKKITFDKDVAFNNPDAEFVSFGHPLFEAILEYVDRNYSTELNKGSVFIDPEGKLNGYILFYEGEIKDGTNTTAGKSLYAYYYDLSSGNVKSVSPTIIWDLAEGEPIKEEDADIEEVKKKVFPKVIEEHRKYMERLREDRKRQGEIKTKYGVKSLEILITELDKELIDLCDRKEKGENVDLVINNKREQMRRYERSKKELEDLIEKEQRLTMSTPSFIGIIRVLPRLSDDSMYSDEEIERLGMEIVMRYERENGREPEDVSKENLGFDIRSRDSNGKVRYIEVKARADAGTAVALTQNEWFKAQRLGDDYYLYVVWNARDPNTRPYIIRNPVANLKVNQKVEIVRYIVPATEIESKGVQGG
jgi:SNF2 family DNA or RNA helicase